MQIETRYFADHSMTQAVMDETIAWRGTGFGKPGI